MRPLYSRVAPAIVVGLVLALSSVASSADFKTLFNEAKDLIGKDKDAEGLAKLQKALEAAKTPSDKGIAWLYMGHAYGKENKEKAIEAYNKAFEIEKANSSTKSGALFSLGNLYVGTGEEEKGLEYFRKTIDFKPGSDSHKAWAAYHAGEVYEKRNEKDKAAEWYREGLGLKKGNKVALARIALNLSAIQFRGGQREEAVETLKTAAALPKQNPAWKAKVLLTLGRYQKVLKDTDGARRSFEAILAVDKAPESHKQQARKLLDGLTK